MPEPQEGESRDEFIGRCIPIVLEDGTAGDRDQAVAICNSMWEQQGAEDEEMDSKAKEHKTLPFFVTKLDGDQGIVEHTVAVMGNVDLGGDRIHPGAFTKTITERGGKVRVLDAHNSGSINSVLGRPLALWEIGQASLSADVRERFPDATGALMARTQFLMDTPEGRGAFSRIKSGAIDEYSIGYDPLDVFYTEEGEDEQRKTVRNLREIRLWEYSPVPFAMNPATSTLGVKKDEPEADPEPPRYVGGEDEEEKGATGATGLPIADRARAWDAQAAQRRVRSWADAEDEPNARYRRAFFWYDAGAADQFGAYKLQFADVVDGTLTAIPRGVFAVAAVLQGSRGGVDIPEGDRGSVRSRVARYYARMRSQFDDETIVPPWEKTKAGRTFSAANVNRIRGAIGAVQDALSDLEEMLTSAMPAEDEEEAKGAPTEGATTGQEQLAGPDEGAPPTPEGAGPDADEPPTKEFTLADIEAALLQIEGELLEET